MTGRVFLHLGPPKTGTTSVQMALQQIQSDQLEYIGVRQPREAHDNADATVLLGVCRGNPSVSEAARDLRKKIEAQVKAGSHVVVSEEKFVVANNESEVREQIRRIVQFFDGLPTTVIVTLRDPKQALPSFFQEIHARLPLNLRGNFHCFADDGRNFCYDYQKLGEFIVALGVDFHLADFREISGGAMNVASLLGPSTIMQGQLSDVRANVSSKKHDASARWIGGVNATDLASLPTAKLLIDKFGLRRLPGWKMLGALARRVPLQRARYRKLELDDVQSAKYLASYEAARSRWAPQLPPLKEDAQA